MKEFIKKNIILIIAFAVPIIFILTITLYVYIPSMLLNTKYNFVYMQCEDTNDVYYTNTCENYIEFKYPIVNNTLTVNPADMPAQDFNKDGILDENGKFTVHFIYHDTKQNEGKEIPLDEVQKMTFHTLQTSPDNVTVSYDYTRGVDIFPVYNSSGNSGYYLTQGSTKKKLNLINRVDQNYYNRVNFKFVGWVTSEK